MKNILEIFLPYQKSFFLNQKKRKVWISSRQIGKSFTLAGILTYKALSTKNGLSLCISTGARAASEIILKCKLFAEAIKLLSRGRINYTATFDQIKFSNGSRVLSLPSSTDGANLRGFSANAVCIDEAGYIQHLDTILQAINPTLSRDANAELILATTPAGRHGPFYELYKNALVDDNWYVQQTTIYDAIDAGLKVDIEALKTLCPDPEIFDIEYNCKFSHQYNAMIDTSILQFGEFQTTGQYYVGIDVGRSNDNTAIVVLNRLSTGKCYLADVILLKKMPYADQLDIIRQLYKKYNFAGYVDQTGIGSAFAEQIHKEISAKISGLQITATNKTPMYEAVRAAIFNRDLSFNEKFKDLIIKDFNLVSRIVNEAGQVKFEAGRQDGHADIISALTLAYKAFKNNFAVSLPQAYFNHSRLM